MQASVRLYPECVVKRSLGDCFKIDDDLINKALSGAFGLKDKSSVDFMSRSSGWLYRWIQKFNDVSIQTSDKGTWHIKIVTDPNTLIFGSGPTLNKAIACAIFDSIVQKIVIFGDDKDAEQALLIYQIKEYLEGKPQRRA